jgi:hypothetical protein
LEEPPHLLFKWLRSGFSREKLYEYQTGRCGSNSG